MKALSEQDHYEILEIHSDASLEEIERAYRMSMITYADDSLAGYSVFSDGDTQALRERIEAAYGVLTNQEQRRDYDSGLGIAPPPEPPEPVQAEEEVATSESFAVTEHSPPPIAELDETEDEGDDFDGPRLRRLRMRHGLEIEDIAGVTKINPSYLRFIEEERFQDLPHRVYVNGFVNAYASCVGLDPKHVTLSYMTRFDEGRKEPRKGRFFDGR
jgi:curved DNA-binding protein CbpA